MSTAVATLFDASLRACPRRAGGAAERAAAPRPAQAVDVLAHRPALMRYAQRALRNAADAEDAVQATLLAALSAPQNFAGRSAPKTWLHGILKHKIMDIFRRQAREPLLEERPERELQDEVDAQFDANGHWREAPAGWGNPQETVAQREFLEVLDACIACLPRTAARAFTMRETMDLEVDEICTILGITPNNCCVMLHRARMKLRGLLEERWFGAAAN